MKFIIFILYSFLLLPVLLIKSNVFAQQPGLHITEFPEDSLLNRAVDYINSGNLDEAERLLLFVDKADTNDWLPNVGREEFHWIVSDYLNVIQRRRQGDKSDRLLQTDRFRFLLQNSSIRGDEIENMKSAFEETLSKVADWSGDSPWQKPYHKTIFVIVSDSFNSPSPARTLIFFWDRQERSPRMEMTTRVVQSRFFRPILAHELTHVVLPHTNRPLAEGMANLVSKDVTGQEFTLRRRGESTEYKTEPWPLEEVLLYNFRAEGSLVKKANKSISSGGFNDETISIVQEMYHYGDELVDLILTKWNRKKLKEFYTTTNRDPNEFDMIEATEKLLAPIILLKNLWQNRFK